MRTRRNREPELPRPEPWNPEQWLEPEPEPAPEPEPEPIVEPEPEPERPQLVSAGPRWRTRPTPTQDVSDLEVTAQIPTIASPQEPPQHSAPLAGAVPDPARNRRPLVIAGGIAAAALIGVALVGWSLIGGTSSPGNDTAPQAATSVAPPADGQQSADADCPSQVQGKVTRGRDAGDQTSGPGVIKAFDYSYYVLRDGAAARKYGTPTAKMGTAEQMTTFIKDQLPENTRHCLTITDEGTGLYTVALDQIPPGGGAPKVIRQQVQTTESNGKYWIVSIESVP